MHRIIKLISIYFLNNFIVIFLTVSLFFLFVLIFFYVLPTYCNAEELYPETTTVKTWWGALKELGSNLSKNSNTLWVTGGLLGITILGIGIYKYVKGVGGEEEITSSSQILEQNMNEQHVNEQQVNEPIVHQPVDITNSYKNLYNDYISVTKKNILYDIKESLNDKKNIKLNTNMNATEKHEMLSVIDLHIEGRKKLFKSLSSFQGGLDHLYNKRDLTMDDLNHNVKSYLNRFPVSIDIETLSLKQKLMLHLGYEAELSAEANLKYNIEKKLGGVLKQIPLYSDISMNIKEDNNYITSEAYQIKKNILLENVLTIFLENEKKFNVFEYFLEEHTFLLDTYINYLNNDLETIRSFLEIKKNCFQDIILGDMDIGASTFRNKPVGLRNVPNLLSMVLDNYFLFLSSYNERLV